MEIFNFFAFLHAWARGTLTALTQHVSRRMEDLRLWHELSYIEVQYVSWDKDERLSLKSDAGLKTDFHKKALGGPNAHLLHSRRVLRTIWEKIVFQNAFLEATNAFFLEIFMSGGI